MKICIVVDDNAGYTPEEALKEGIYLVRMPIIIDGEEYYENRNIDYDTFYNKLENDANISTSQPSIGEILELWNELLKDYDQIVHMPMSSGLSATCETAKGLAKAYEGKVFVVDNHRISVTLKSAVNDAKKLIEQGKNGQEIKEYLEKTAYESKIFIMVNTLKYLKKGGRITPAAALVGEALHLKPVLTINGGKLDAFKKCIGVKKSKKAMIEAIKKERETTFKDVPNDKLDLAFAYTKDYDLALEFALQAKKELGFDTHQAIDPLSLSVATHTGPGVIGIGLTKKIK